MNTPKLHLTYALTSLFAKFIFANSFYLYGSPKFTHVWYVYVCVCAYVCVHLITHSVCLSTEAVKVSNPYSHIDWSSNSLIS